MKTAYVLSMALLATSAVVHAQSYSNDWFTIAGGGGTSTNSTLAISGTIGQSGASEMGGGNLTLDGGFWGIIATNVPPSITSLPQSRTNDAGSTANFAVTAQGSLPLSYQWRKGGNNLSNGANISGATGSALRLVNVQPADAGAYTVVVTNTSGSITSAVANLTVVTNSAVRVYGEGGTGGIESYRIGYVNGGVGFCFVPLNDLTVTRVGYLDEVFIPIANPIIQFWSSNNFVFHVLASYQLGPGTLSGEIVYTNITFSLLAGSNYCVTLQDGPLSAGNTVIVRAWLNEVPPLEFEVRPELTNYSSVQVDAATNFHGFQTNAFILGVNFNFVVNSSSTPPQPFSLVAPTRLPDGTIQFSLNGEVGRGYRVEYSSNLVNWFPLTNFTSTSASTTVLDPTVGPARRFYRGVTP